MTIHSALIQNLAEPVPLRRDVVRMLDRELLGRNHNDDSPIKNQKSKLKNSSDPP